MRVRIYIVSEKTSAKNMCAFAKTMRAYACNMCAYAYTICKHIYTYTPEHLHT